MDNDAIPAGRPLTTDHGSIRSVLRWGKQRLSTASTETPGLDAEVLLRHVLGVDRTALFARLADPISPDAHARYEALLDQRAVGLPIAYLTGAKEFMGFPIAVTPDVLVPRPETEILVEWALNWLRKRGSGTVVDVGTGSGAIALGLAHELGPDWDGRIIASDVSSAALDVAARNRERLGLADRVELVLASLLDGLDEPVALLLGNLPYLTPEQIASNPGLAAEPRLALDGGADGTALIAALLRDAPRVLRPGGAIGLEIDPSQTASVVALATAAFPGAEIVVLRDLAGLDRHLTIATRSVATNPQPRQRRRSRV